MANFVKLRRNGDTVVVNTDHIKVMLPIFVHEVSCTKIYLVDDSVVYSTSYLGSAGKGGDGSLIVDGSLDDTITAINAAVMLSKMAL